ncbi:MAG: DUF4189 domain-containing protein [Microcoleaceae cyanobacterium]
MRTSLYWFGLLFTLVSSQIATTAWSQQPQSQIPDNYGAIATSPDGRIWGYSYDYPNREQAEQKALSECGRSGADCEVQVWFKNACGSVARNDQGNIGWAWADTRAAAEAQAILACNAEGCSTETWVCTTRY